MSHAMTEVHLEKRCIKCGEVKPLREFYEYAKMRDGHIGKCKACFNEYRRAYNYDSRYRAKSIKQAREYRNARRNNVEFKRRSRELQIKRRERDKEKYKARTAVNNAVYLGNLKKLPCEVCGERKVEAHHSDYSKPMQVQWLCFKHHREIEHGQLVGPEVPNGFLV